MAILDRNFLATPDFFVSTGEGGQTITITLYPTLESVGGYEEEHYSLRGWNCLIFQSQYVLDYISSNETRFSVKPRTVTPNCIDNFMLWNFVKIEGSIVDTSWFGVYNFMDFVEKNPIHISKLNLRAANENVLPQQIVVYTPNLFTGQSDRQIIDVASKKTADQYQNGIITIDNADLIIARNSSIEFVCSMDVDNGDQPEQVLPENELYIDITIDKYLSLEKALIENLKNM